MEGMDVFKPRITLTDTVRDIIVKLSEGNPGALTVLTSMIGLNPEGWIHILKFDDWNIHGPLIWICFKDLCDSNLTYLYDLVKHNRLEEVIESRCQTDAIFRRTWRWHTRG